MHGERRHSDLVAETALVVVAARVSRPLPPMTASERSAVDVERRRRRSGCSRKRRLEIASSAALVCQPGRACSIAPVNMRANNQVRRSPVTARAPGDELGGRRRDKAHLASTRRPPRPLLRGRPVACAAGAARRGSGHNWLPSPPSRELRLFSSLLLLPCYGVLTPPLLRPPLLIRAATATANVAPPRLCSSGSGAA
jgi:hypothetical protein